MNEDILNDLKEFITVTISQQLAQQTAELEEKFQALGEKLDNKIDSVEARLSKQIQGLSGSVAGAMTTQSDETDKQLKDHETRITALEAKPA